MEEEKNKFYQRLLDKLFGGKAEVTLTDGFSGKGRAVRILCQYD